MDAWRNYFEVMDLGMLLPVLCIGYMMGSKLAYSNSHIHEPLGSSQALSALPINSFSQTFFTVIFIYLPTYILYQPIHKEGDEKGLVRGKPSMDLGSGDDIGFS